MIFDIVLLAAHLFTVALCEGGSGKGGCRAEADRVIRGSQNLAETVQTGRWNEEPENPERTPARYATA